MCNLNGESQDEMSFLNIMLQSKCPNICCLKVALFLPYQGHIVQLFFQVYNLCSVLPYVRSVSFCCLPPKDINRDKYLATNVSSWDTQSPYKTKGHTEILFP